MQWRGTVRFIGKAYDEMDVVGVDETDALDVLAALSAGDFFERITSNVPPYGYLYVFKPNLGNI